MELKDFFTAEKLSDNTTKIRTITGELCYLISGSEKAALIDTGTGLGDLPAFVKTLTDKEVIVLLTHGHVDHAYGTTGFPVVYMNSLDNELFDEQSDESRREYSKMSMGKEKYAELKAEDFKYPCRKDFLELKGGMSFDLGGIHLDVISSPGHTQGSVSVIIREERVLILGDSCNPRTFLFDDKHSLGVKSYKDSLLKLKAETDSKYDRVYLSHGPGEDAPDMIDSAISLCEDIMEGRSDEIPFNFMGSLAYTAKATDEIGKRLDGGSANIVYSKSRIFS